MNDHAAEARSWLISALIVIVLGLLAVFFLRPAGDWLVTEAGGSVRVDVRRATGGASEFTGVDQQFDDGFVKTVFAHDGFYEGVPFSGSFERDGTTLLRFSPRLVPSDGVPDVFMYALSRNGSIVMRALVDDDFKDAFGPVNFVWGAAYQNERPFAYKALSKGIYMDAVPDDPARRATGTVYGGVALGRITSDDAKRGSTNVTAVIVY